MPAPTSIVDLSTTAASNYPAGSELPSILDDSIRALSSVVKYNVSKGSDIASSATITIPTQGSYFVVTGTTSITAISNTNAFDGREVTLKFSGALTFTHGAGLILPGAVNITTASGDVAKVVYESTGVWRCTSYTFSAGVGNVTGQSSSVDSEIALFSGTGGKTIKRATTTGILKAASGVIAAATAGTDYASAGAVTGTGITMSTARLLGRTTASSGAVEEITVGAGLTLSAGSLTATSSGSMPMNYITGLTLSNNGTDATNDIDIAVGAARDATNTVDITLASALTKQLDVNWAVGTNQGMLDTGTVGNNTYHLWLIKRSDTSVVDVLASLSASAPTMPANYDYKRRIGSIVRAAAANRAFIQSGIEFRWKTLINDINTTIAATTATTRTLSLPTGIKVKALVEHGIDSGTQTSERFQLLTDLAETDSTPSATLFTAKCGAYNTTDAVKAAASSYCEVVTNTSAQIRSRGNYAATGTEAAIVITTLGWIDYRLLEGA